MPIKRKLVERLQQLRNLTYTNPTEALASNVKAEKALKLMFQVVRKRTIFTEEEQWQIGNLLIDAVLPIQLNVESTFCRYRTRLDTSVLAKRSVLQFLVEDYGHFSARGSTLREELEKVNIQKSIEILDDIIENWCDFSDSDEGKTDPESAGASDVPATHTWWNIFLY